MEPPLPRITPARMSPLAIWSLVLGVLGMVLRWAWSGLHFRFHWLLVVCVGLLFAIPAIICGHIAYSRIKKSAGALTGEGMALAGLTTGYVGVVLSLAWIPLMFIFAIPNYISVRDSVRETVQKNMCLNNLRRIEGAKEVWALQNNKDTNSTPTMEELIPFLKGDTNLRCPAGGTYSINRVGLPPSCTIASHDLFNPGSTIQEILNDRTNSVH